MSLSQRVATARKKKGLTQEELADLTNLTVRTIQRIENGETTPRPYTLKAIATVLDTTFEALHSTEVIQTEPADSTANVKTMHQREDTLHFLQLFCLSCFSYLLLPFIHFLLPIYLLRRRKEQNPIVLAYACKLIRVQIYWVIVLNLLLLLTLAYNIFCEIYFTASYTINYLIPFFVMYLVNALIISKAYVRSQRNEFFTPALSK